MSVTPLISVILPTYNPSDYILKCFSSLELQELDSCKFEVLVLLNGDEHPYKEWLQKELDSCNFKSKLF